MPMSILFWGLMILWVILWLCASWPLGWGSIPTVILVIVISLLGVKVFGKIVTP